MTDDALAACLHIAARHRAGELSAQVALMQMLLASEDVALVERALAQLAGSQGDELARVYADNRAGCARIADLLRREQTLSGTRSVAERLAFQQQLFDGLVAQSEETSVALYSLGSPQILAAATAEIVTLLEARGLLGAGARVLDVGCGIGRMAIALAPRVARVDGIDLSPRMVEVASRRCAELTNVSMRVCSGQDFAGAEDQTYTLVLAVDSFPYVVEAGPTLVEQLFAEAARVLVPGGHFVLLNYSYRDDLARDSVELEGLAQRHGFTLQAPGERPLALWDGALFALRRAESRAASVD